MAYLFNAFICKSRTTSKLNLIRRGDWLSALTKKKNPALWLGFVKMGGKRLRQQPPA